MLTEKDLQFPLEPCPFYESKKIKYSLKKTERFELHYHACMYCADCLTYGPRILSGSFRHDDYIAGRDVEDDAELLARAKLINYLKIIKNTEKASPSRRSLFGIMHKQTCCFLFLLQIVCLTKIIL